MIKAPVCESCIAHTVIVTVPDFFECSSGFVRSLVISIKKHDAHGEHDGNVTGVFQLRTGQIV